MLEMYPLDLCPTYQAFPCRTFAPVSDLRFQRRVKLLRHSCPPLLGGQRILGALGSSEWRLKTNAKGAELRPVLEKDRPTQRWLCAAGCFAISKLDRLEDGRSPSHSGCYRTPFPCIPEDPMKTMTDNELAHAILEVRT
jgi:hypothetical protein